MGATKLVRASLTRALSTIKQWGTEVSTVRKSNILLMRSEASVQQSPDQGECKKVPRVDR